jgi:hypothetical protein
MKLVIRTMIFHLLCIIVFAYLYLYLSEDFDSSGQHKHNKYSSYLDFFLLSTTIQSGVGISDLYPISTYSKMIVIIQQCLMLLTHVITLYIFTL